MNKKDIMYKIFGLLLALLALTILTGCTPPDEAEMPENEEMEAVGEEPDPEEPNDDQDAIPVTLERVGISDSFYIDVLGTVEASENPMVYPSLAGQVIQSNVEEGDFVNKGDVLFVLGGVDDVEHQSITQHRLAQSEYDSAVESFSLAVNSKNAGVAAAQLQLQSAKNQTQGSYIGLEGDRERIDAARYGNNVTERNLQLTRRQNMLALEGLENTIRDLLIDRGDAIDEMIDTINDTEDDDMRDELEDELDKLAETFDKQLRDLDIQYDTLRLASISADNQVMGQLRQGQSQEFGLINGQQITTTSLGLNNGTSAQVRLAEQGLVTTQVQGEIGVAQARARVKVAEINLKSAADQLRLLLVRAPAKGQVGEVAVSQGDIVSPQRQLSTIVGTHDLQIKVGVSADDASRLYAKRKALVTVDGKEYQAPIVSVSPTLDAQSKLATVTLNLIDAELRSGGLRPNQTVEVRLPISGSAEFKKAIYIPLDAVTIGSQQQFVYLPKNGTAEQRLVTLGEIHGDQVEILSGLKKGEQIIVVGARRLSEGQSIKILKDERK